MLTGLGQRDAVVPHRRGGGAAHREAGHGEDDVIELRRGPRLPAGADHGMEPPIHSRAWCATGRGGYADAVQTMEVAVARVYNWDVVQKRKDKAEGKGEEEQETN